MTYNGWNDIKPNQTISLYRLDYVISCLISTKTFTELCYFSNYLKLIFSSPFVSLVPLIVIGFIACIIIVLSVCRKEEKTEKN